MSDNEFFQNGEEELTDGEIGMSQTNLFYHCFHSNFRVHS